MLSKQINLAKLSGAWLLVLMLMCASASVFAADSQPESFATPEQAVEALVTANRSNDQDQILKVLGQGAKDIISSGDAAADQDGRAKFLAAYDASHKLESESDDKEVLIVGDRQWPLPIPLVRVNGQWQFDAAAGEEEILNRRIGRNELNVIEVCRAYVEAQREYADTHHHEYAMRFVSHEGKQDGLYWPANPGEPESPLGPLFAFAQTEDTGSATHIDADPYHGYYYKILTSQSAKAPSGAMQYISKGHMTKGFALLAFPAKYGDSGIMSFMVNQNGIVVEKDLGPNTAAIARHINQYNPDESWNIP